MPYKFLKSSDFWGSLIRKNEERKHSSTESLCISSGIESAIQEDSEVIPETVFQGARSDGDDNGLELVITIFFCCIVICMIGFAIVLMANDQQLGDMTLRAPLRSNPGGF